MSVARTPGRGPARLPDHGTRGLRAVEPRDVRRSHRGDRPGRPAHLGLDAAVGAAFMALLWPRLRDRRNRLVALAAAAVALGMVPIAPAGVPVLAAAGWRCWPGALSDRPDRPSSRRPTDDLDRGPRRALGCYLLKLAGLSVPPRVLARPAAERIADLTRSRCSRRWWRCRSSAAAHSSCSTPGPSAWPSRIVLLLLRAPFLVVVFGAALTAAVLRML